MRLHNQILTLFGVIAVLALLYVGALFILKSPGDGGTTLPPITVDNTPANTPMPIEHPFGTVTARSATSITILGPDKKSQTFVIDSGTRVVDEKGNSIKLTALTVGSLASITSLEVKGQTIADTIRMLSSPPPLPPSH